ncbi:endonuclease/exonuclease/phosphatase family protein [Pontibacter saemangeumensis]|uniref:Endonuclease/exonuclease/phosphatase family protein n=1 Tax=Pontibacter saemangeumensis TaxID=1084525 RepID=A0ABP8M7T6_9BACT
MRTQDHGYVEWAGNHLWIGENRNKGLGIFVRNDLAIEPLYWSNIYKDHYVKYFLPCLINKDFQLLGIWAHHNNSPNFGYIGQMWKYLQVNKGNFGKILLAGDLNSNAIWDEWDRWWNHSDVLRELHELGIESLYHRFFKEGQGKETNPTFFMNRKQERPYHIDYFLGSMAFSSRLSGFGIGAKEMWLKMSDHLPLICDFDEQHNVSA